LPKGFGDPADCRIYNIHGRMVHQCVISEQNNVVKTHLEKGIYMIRILSGNEVLSCKMVME
jgi:hypothetical protein